MQVAHLTLSPRSTHSWPACIPEQCALGRECTPSQAHPPFRAPHTFPQVRHFGCLPLYIQRDISFPQQEHGVPSETGCAITTWGNSNRIQILHREKKYFAFMALGFWVNKAYLSYRKSGNSQLVQVPVRKDGDKREIRVHLRCSHGPSCPFASQKLTGLCSLSTYKDTFPSVNLSPAQKNICSGRILLLAGCGWGHPRSLPHRCTFKTVTIQRYPLFIIKTLIFRQKNFQK